MLYLILIDFLMALEILMVMSVLTFLDRLRDAEELGAEGGGEGAYGERE